MFKILNTTSTSTTNQHCLKVCWSTWSLVLCVLFAPFFLFFLAQKLMLAALESTKTKCLFHFWLNTVSLENPWPPKAQLFSLFVHV